LLKPVIIGNFERYMGKPLILRTILGASHKLTLVNHFIFPSTMKIILDGSINWSANIKLDNENIN